MSVKGFRFNDVVHKYDYDSLDNIPTPDKTLTKDGEAADSKTVGDAITTLHHLVGTPLVASSAASMTDRTKIYVYTGSETGYVNGHWYYFDGTSWADGGVYNSTALETDKTLTVENAAADAKKTGDSLDDLKSALTQLDDLVETGNPVVIETPVTFESGVIHGANYGSHNSSSTTGYSLQKIYLGDIYKFDATKYKVALVGYSDDGTYKTVGSFLSESPVTVDTSGVFGQSGVEFASPEFRLKTEADLSASDYTALGFKTVEVKDSAFATKTYVNDNFVADTKLKIYNLEKQISTNLPIANKWGDATINSDGSITVGAGEYYFINYDVSRIQNELVVAIDTASTKNFLINLADVMGNGGDNKWTTQQFDSNTQYVIAPKTDITKKYIVVRLDNRTGSTAFTVNKVYVGDNARNLYGSECWVSSTNGNDSNDGSAEHPYATIQRGVDSMCQTVHVEVGEYSGQVRIENKSNLHIVPYGIGTYSGATPNTPKIYIDGNNTLANAIVIANSIGIVIEDVWCDNTTSNCVDARNSTLDMTDCWFSNAAANNGLYLYNVSGVFHNCIAFNIALNSGASTGDGFNIHGYCNTQFIDCVAHDCNDDGISHHEGCTGFISGGEYYNCGKGGVASPTHGAKVDVVGVYSHDNGFGLYAATDSSNPNKASGKVSNCVFKGNASADMAIINTDIVGWNNKYTTTYIPTQTDYTEIS